MPPACPKGGVAFMAILKKSSPPPPEKKNEPPAPAGESAARTPGKELVTQRNVTPAPPQADEQIQSYIDLINSPETATRMREDLVSTGLMAGGEDILDAIAADMGMEKIVLSAVPFT